MLDVLAQTTVSSGGVSGVQFSIGFIVGVILAIVTYRQAKAGGSNKAVLWAIVVLFFGLLGYLIFWLVEARKYNKS
jgi:multisubunit Na+/H+ antiporter MnhE subunit